MCWIVTKTNSGRNFQFAKFSDSDFFLSNRKNIFRYTSKIIPWQIFQFLIFILSRKICHCQSHWVHNFWFFFLYFGFLPLLGKFWTSLSVSLLAGIIWENFNKQPWIENCEGFHSHDRVVQKASDMSAADWRYQTLVKNYCELWYFFLCVVMAFYSGLEILV